MSWKVLNKEYIGTSRVYDLTIEDSHKFMVEGVVVHNSSDSPNLNRRVL